MMNLRALVEHFQFWLAVGTVAAIAAMHWWPSSEVRRGLVRFGHLDRRGPLA